MIGDKDNVITDSDKEELIGFYRDLVAYYKHYINEFIANNDTEQAKTYIEELEEINEYSEYDGLLVLSENNGMGFTCDKYRDDYEVAEWVAENIAPEDDDAMPKIFGDYDRQKAFMEEVNKYMYKKGDC